MADPITTVPLDNDHIFSYLGTTPAVATGRDSNAVGVTGLQGWFAASKETADTALAGTTVTLVARSTTTHEYYGTLARALLNTALTPFLNKVVYEVLARDGFVETAEPVRVVLTRRPNP